MSLDLPQGVLLLNVGTPDAPTPSALRSYLSRFLDDPRVLDMPTWSRRLLLYGAILPFRPRHSAEAYQKIWTEKGSPILIHGKAFAESLRQKLGEGYRVALGTAYGNPSIESTLDNLLSEPLSGLTLFPLFPQYASATSGAVQEAVLTHLMKRQHIPALRVVKPFFDDPGFLDALAERGRTVISEFKPDHLLFSYHGLPERQIRKREGAEGVCLEPVQTCCETLHAGNLHCYRAQCFATTRALLPRLSWESSRHTTSFQSRLGRIPWIPPYTEETLVQLAQQGIKRLAVFSPAFVADCLETLEEIGIRARETFREAGGEELTLVPSLNNHPAWVSAAAEMIRASRS
jgi:ferrochelatase